MMRINQGAKPLFRLFSRRLASLSVAAAMLAMAWFVGTATPSAEAAGQGALPLTIKCVGAAQDNAVVFTGIPFPPGELRDVNLIELRASGAAVPRQVQPLAQYPDGSIRAALLGFRITLTPGQVVAAEVRYGVQTGLPAGSEIPWGRNTEVLALLPARWYGDSGVFAMPFLPADENQILPAFESRLRARFDVTSLTPDPDPDVRNYYDHTHALYMTLLRTGGPDAALRLIRDEVWQYRENEILHVGEFRGQYAAGSLVGLNAYPMSFATIRRMYVQGLVDDYYVSGDPRSLAVAREMGEALLRDAPLQGQMWTWTERVPGLALQSLCALYEATLDERYLTAVRMIATIEMDHQAAMAVKYPNQGATGQTGAFVEDRNGQWFDGAESEASGCGSPWMTTILAEGLIRAYWLTGHARLRDSVVAASDWLVDAAFAPKSHPLNGEGGDTFWYIAVDPGNPDATLPLNPMFLQMLGFAHQVTGDARYMSIAQRILAENWWGRSIKEFNQGMRGSGQGLYLLSRAPGTLALTLKPQGEAWDTTPPSVPSGLAIDPGDRELGVRWAANPESDLAGYLVFYGFSADRVVIRLTEQAIPNSACLVPGLDNGVSYYFTVVAVDRAGNQSAPCAPVRGMPYAGAGNTFSISGAVTVDGRPAGGVVVAAGALSTASGADGSYSLGGLSAGTHSLTASKAGVDFGAGRSVTVGPSRTGVDFAGTNGAPTFTIAGSVNVGGSGLAGVTVSAGGASATTSAVGAYTLGGLPAGTYTVSASRAGYTFGAARSITVGPDRAGVDFTATPTDGPGVPTNVEAIGGNARVDLRWKAVGGTTSYRVYYAFTADGRRLEAGTTADVEFTHTGLDNGATYWYVVTAVASGVESAPSTPVSARTSSAYYEIAGTVRSGGSACAGAVVTAGPRSATSKADGAYRLPGLEAGIYTVTCSKSGLAFAVRTATLGPSREVDFAAEAPATYAISGTVRLAGAGLPGVAVSAGGRTATTDAAGVYLVTDLPAGTHTVSAAKAGYSMSAPQSVTLGPTKTGVDFTATEVPVRPGTPGGLTATAGNAQVRLKWNAVPGAAGYHVYYAYTATGGLIKANGAAVSATAYTVTGLQNQVTYWFRVSAVAGDLEGDRCAPVSCMPYVPTFEVKGTVRAGAAPLAGVKVTVGSRSAITTGTGTYVVGGLTAGSYTVAGRKSGYTIPARAVTVGPSRTVDLTATITTGKSKSKGSKKKG